MAPASQRKTGAAEKSRRRIEPAGGDQPPVVTTPVTSFTSLNYQQAACFSSAVGLRQSRLIRADDFLDVESCIPESFRNLDDQRRSLRQCEKRQWCGSKWRDDVTGGRRKETWGTIDS